MVQTLWTFASYVTVFEDEINAAGRTVINTSPNGALIRGCKHKSLAQAMNTKPAHPVTHIVNDAWRARQKCAAADMLAGLGAIEADIEEMRRVCDRAAASVKQLKYLDPANRDDKRKLGRLAQQWHKARKQVSDSVAADVLNRCVARTALQLRDMAWAALDKKTDAEKREHEAEYLRAFFTGYSDAAQFYLPHLRKTMRELANAKP
jgi:hypothetical protein